MRTLDDFRAYLYKLKTDTINDWQKLILMFKADGKNLPNKITETRLIFSLIPGLLLVIGRFNVNLRWFAFFLFVAISLTDKIDGYIARKNDQVTELGKILDPAVDKILIVATVVAISFIDRLVLLPVLIILICEVLVSWSAFRATHRDIDVAVTKFGKAKMFLQCVAIAFLILPLSPDMCVNIAQSWAMVIAALMNVISLFLYLWVFYRK